jgi:hypothetical protein
VGTERAAAKISDPVGTFNVVSWRVMEQMGMRREGHLLENAWINDEWQDSYLYAVLKREWTRTRGKHTVAEEGNPFGISLQRPG